MESSDIRWMLAGLFVAFLLIVALSDLVKRKPSSRKKKSEGFRHIRHGGPIERHRGWKGK